MLIRLPPLSGEKSSDFSGTSSLWLMTLGWAYERDREETRRVRCARIGTAVCDGERRWPSVGEGDMDIAMSREF
jgi:hypothetical protein